MLKFDYYLSRDFVQSFFATLIVLLVVSLGGVVVDILGNIADGRLPAQLLLSQLGLQTLVYLPIILPLALMLGLLLALARLYRDSEMAVFSAVGVGPKRLLRPLLIVIVPVILVIALCSIWLGPWANRTANTMVEEANRSLIIAGLEAGRFTELPGGGIVYLTAISADGEQLGQVFMQRERDGRRDIVTSQRGAIYFVGKKDRYLRLEDGFQVQEANPGDLDYRLMHFAKNDVALPERANTLHENDPEMLTTSALVADSRPETAAELHRRLAPPLLALAFALLTLPLSRSAPRQQRYGRMMMGFMAYLVGTNLMFVGAQAIAKGKVPQEVGLWWLTLPLLAFAIWLYLRDGRLARRRRHA